MSVTPHADSTALVCALHQAGENRHAAFQCAVLDYQRRRDAALFIAVRFDDVALCARLGLGFQIGKFRDEEDKIEERINAFASLC